MSELEIRLKADILSKEKLTQVKRILKGAGHWDSIEEIELLQPCGVPLHLKGLIEEGERYGMDPNVLIALKELRSHKILKIGMGCD